MMIDNTERAQVGWGFWLLWVLASGVGMFVAATWAEDIAEVVQGATVGIVGGQPGPFGWSVMGALNGASIGIAQWLVLRRHVARAGWWVLASILGGLVGGAVLAELSLILFGVSVGIAQWFVLRRHVARAGWWVLASPVSFLVGFFLGDNVLRLIGVNSVTAPTNLYFGAAGVIYGAVTGGVMVWLLRQSDKEQTGLPRDAAEPEGGGQSIAKDPSSSQDAA